MGAAAGRALRDFDASLVAFVVLPEGHQSDGDGLQERPDGGRELQGEASESGSRGGQGSGGHRQGRVEWSLSRCLVSSDCVLGTALGTSRSDVVEKTDSTQMKTCPLQCQEMTSV